MFDTKLAIYHPFISTVTTNLNPVGLPPIRNPFTGEEKVPLKKESNTQKKNKKVIKKIEKLKKLEKMVEEKDFLLDEIKKSKVYDTFLKKDKEIKEIRKELYGIEERDFEVKESSYKVNEPYNMTQGLNVPIKNDNKDNGNYDITNKQERESQDSQYLKMNPKYHNIKERLEKIQEKEVDDLVDFAKNLDFDKYLKDLEIREALNLIKIQTDQEEPPQIPISNDKNEENKNIEQQNHEENITNKDGQKDIKLPDIYSYTVPDKPENHDEHNKDWGDQKTKEEKEFQKQQENVIQKCYKDNSLVRILLLSTRIQNLFIPKTQ